MGFLDFIFSPDIEKMKEKGDITGLIKALEDDKEEIKEKAVKTLSEIGRPAAKPLVESLSDGEKGVYSADVLRRMGKPALKELKTALDTDNERVKRKIIQIMGEIGGKSAVDPLFDLYKTETNLMNRSISTAIIKIGEEAVDPLVDHLDDRNKTLRKKAADLLKEIGWTPSNDSEKSRLLIAKQDWVGLLNMGQPAVEHLVNVLDDEDVNIHKEAAQILGQIGAEEVVPPLIKAVKLPEYRSLRSVAATALGGIGDARAVEPLINALKDETSNSHRISLELDPREEIIKALGKIGDIRATDILIETLDSKDIYIRESAAEALGGIKNEKAVEPLTKALKDYDEDVRQKAAESLGKIKDHSAVEPLINALDDENIYVRQNAANALGEIKSSRAVDALVKALGEREIEINAAEALGKIGNKKAVEPLSRSLLEGDNSIIRWKAANALGEIGDVEAVKPLVKTLDAEDWEVRMNVIIALEKIGDERSAPYIEKRLEDQNRYVKESAERALKTLKGEPS